MGHPVFTGFLISDINILFLQDEEKKFPGIVLARIKI